MRVWIVAACPGLRARLHQLVAAQRGARLVAVTIEQREVIEQSSGFRLELIFLGVDRTDGQDALANLLQIKQRFPTAVIVAVAPDASLRGQIKCLAAGADLFLTAKTLGIEVPMVISRLRRRPLHERSHLASPRMFRVTRSRERP